MKILRMCMKINKDRIKKFKDSSLEFQVINQTEQTYLKTKLMILSLGLNWINNNKMRKLLKEIKKVKK